MKHVRRSIITCLQTTTGISLKSAQNYEAAIFNLVSELYPDEIADFYSKIAFDKVGQLVQAENKTTRDIILKEIGDLALVPSDDELDFYPTPDEWDSMIYDPLKKTYFERIDKTTIKPSAIKGVYKCPPAPRGCGGDEFYIWEEQRRRSDEGACVLRECRGCGKRGKE